MSTQRTSFDVFLSYRRQNGAEAARALRSEFELAGVRTFLDVDDLRAGHFDEALLTRIAETPNFVVLLTPGALDERHGQDWLRRELAHALATKRNIIPVLKDGFQFPDQLPDEIRGVSTHQSVPYSHDFFTAMMQRLIADLDRGGRRRDWGARAVEPARSVSPIRRGIIIGTLVAAAVIAVIAWAWAHRTTATNAVAASRPVPADSVASVREDLAVARSNLDRGDYRDAATLGTVVVRHLQVLAGAYAMSPEMKKLEADATALLSETARACKAEGDVARQRNESPPPCS